MRCCALEMKNTHQSNRHLEAAEKVNCGLKESLSGYFGRPDAISLTAQKGKRIFIIYEQLDVQHATKVLRRCLKVAGAGGSLRARICLHYLLNTTKRIDRTAS